jgi:Undecaprenyl-phosphate glucose phosphotransferase
MDPLMAETLTFQSARLPTSRRTISFAPRVFVGLVGLTDFLAIMLASATVYGGYVGWDRATLPIYLGATSVHVAMIVTLFWRADLYAFESVVHPRSRLTKLAAICGLVTLVLATLGFALKISAEFSRIWFFSVSPFSTLLIGVGRIGVHGFMQAWSRAGWLTRNIVIVGSGAQAQRFVSWIHELNEPWNKIIGVFDDRRGRIGPMACGYPVLGTLNGLVRFVRQNRIDRIDDVVIALPWSAEARLLEIAEKLSELPVRIRVASDLAGFSFGRRSHKGFGGIPVIEVMRKPVSGWGVAAKSLEDFLLGSVLLVFFAPLMLCIALAIKFDSPGPVLFRQRRYGFNNQEIIVLKFRTMRHRSGSPDGGPQARPGDPRVTRVGRVLRRTSLDELPQLFNVLGGTMSLVGPRPHAVEHNEQYASLIRGYSGRHRMKPGITGWAQVNGLRGETDTPDKMRARLEYDRYYIENWSPFFDLRVLLMTPFLGFVHKHAY